MPLTRSQKAQVVEDMAARLKEANALVVADYRGLSDAEMKALRGELRKSGATMTVIKNTLARRAFEMAGIEPPANLLGGPTAIALFVEDLSTPAKAILDFAKKQELLEVKGGMLEGKHIDAAGVEMMSKLPTKDELRGLIVGVIQAPSRQLVSVLQAPMRDLVGVLRAKVDQGEVA